MTQPALHSPARIKPLSTLLANQIAAGEVVERPASVVKELLENALDAGASELDLEVEEGGRKLIRLRDNGCGVHPEDLALALQRHATSKIHTGAELARVATLGFRGEALASIASVSRLSFISRVSGEQSGWSLSSDDPELRPSAHPQGSTIAVRDLFYNTPARRKFLRAERTEFNHIEEVVRRIALSRFDVALKLRHNGREIFRLPAIQGREGQRLSRLLGQSFMAQSLQLDYAAAGMRLHGWLLDPSSARAQNDLQYLFLNGRVIRDRLVSHALRQAHQERIAPGRHPAYLLYLEVDPAAVDVNVHPTKHEVRFRDARLVHDFLLRAIEQALERGEEGPESPSSSDSQQLEPADAQSSQVAQPVPTAKQHTANTRAVSTLFPRPTPLPGRSVTPQRIAEQANLYAPAQPPRQRPHSSPAGQLLAQLEGRLLLWQCDDGLLIIDWHQLTRELAWLRLGGESLVSQPLLLPAAVSLEPYQLDCLLQLTERLARFGLVFDSLGEGQLVVRQVPSGYRECEWALLMDRLANLEQVDLTDAQLRRTIAHAAPTLRQPSRAELEALMLEWQEAAPDALEQLSPPLGRRLKAGELSQLLGLESGAHDG